MRCFCWTLFWLFSKPVARFPVFPKVRDLSRHSPRPAPSPQAELCFRVCCLFPDVGSVVMIMGLENVVAVMTPLASPVSGVAVGDL